MVVAQRFVILGRHALAALVAGFSLFPVMSIAADTTSPAHARIEIAHGEGSVTVSGVVLGVAPAALEAELKVERQGVAGAATLLQHKHVDITPGARVVFGKASVSFSPGDSLLATAILTSGGTIIAESRTIIGAGTNSTSGGN